MRFLLAQIWRGLRARARAIRLLGGGLLALLVVVLLVVGPSRWERHRLLDLAEESLGSGDKSKAAIYLNAAYESDPDHERTLALIVDLFEQSSHPSVLHWDEKLLRKVPESVPVRLRAARHAMDFEDPLAALRVLSTMPEAGENVEYSRLMAAASGSAGRGAEAIRKHLLDAAASQPGNEFDTLNLAIVDASSSPSGSAERQRAIGRLEKLAEGGGRAAAWALLALVQLEIPTGPGGERNPHLERLAGMVDERTHLRFSILALEAAHAHGGSHWREMLARVRDHADGREQPQPTFWTMDWMNRHGLYEESIAWAESPAAADKSRKFPASLAVAEAFVGARRWAELAAFLDDQSWPGMDPLRLAMRAVGLEKSAARSGQSNIAAIARSQALERAGRSEAQLSLIESAARKHGWDDLHEEVLWKIAESRNVSLKTSLGACARLKRRYLAAGDLANCYRVAGRSVEIMPTDFIETNNLIYMALLTGQDPATQLAKAKDLRDRYPGVRPILSTCALAHYFAGDHEQARQLLHKLPQPFREHPSIAPFCGVILAHAGEWGEAEEYLGRTSTLHFEEEENLVASARRLLGLRRANTVE